MECSASRSSPAIFQECHPLHITIVQGTPLHTAVQGVVPLQWRTWGCQSSFILHITWILSSYCFTHTCYYLTTCIVEEPPAVCWRTVPVHWSLQSIEVCALSIKEKCVQDAAPRYLAKYQSRSAVSWALLVPWTQVSTGQCNFAVYGPTTWNLLPIVLWLPVESETECHDPNLHWTGHHIHKSSAVQLWLQHFATQTTLLTYLVPYYRPQT